MQKQSATQLNPIPSNPALESTTLEPLEQKPDSEIRLLVLDIDGTIAGQSNQVNPAVLTAIKAVQANGVLTAIATGRMYCSALRFHRAVGSTLPLICYQGALIKDPVTQVTHRHWPVPPERVHELLDHFEQPTLKSQLAVHLYVEDQLYVREISRETEDYAERTGIQPIPIGDLRQVVAQAPTKVLALSEDPILIEALLVNLRQRYAPTDLYLTRSVPTFFEATHPQVNKGAAVRYLAEELLNLKPENVMAIGDNWNDMEMIEYAGMGVAMGDAPEAVKGLAQWVAPSVEQDGVATTIKTFLL